MNNLIRLFNLEHGRYGETFAMCNACVKTYAVKGCLIDTMGKTDRECQCSEEGEI